MTIRRAFRCGHQLKSSCFHGRHSIRSMGTFVPNLSPVTGKMEWVLQDEHYDYHQEIARSAYADMLHDTERNQKYYLGLKRAIHLMHQSGQAAHVLDIGTGTGLLSMMAAASGADTVTACEAFVPMAECARKLIQQNGFGDKITLIPKRSTEVTVGKDSDMPRRANILVTEVFDTELIGEGAIGTFHHAHEKLLEKDCLVVPRAAKMYVQLVQSEKLRKWNQLLPIKIKGHDDVRPPTEFSRCGGAPSLHDLQLDQVSCDQFQPLSQPIKVFRFDYTGKSEIKFKDRSKLTVESLNDGRIDAIFMWWDLEMDPEGEITLSCAPSWGHPDPENMQWRDHWMQAIYYPNVRRSVQKGETITLVSNHDDYSLWFDVQDFSEQKLSEDKRGVCRCGAHMTYSRPRIAMLNDDYRNTVYIHTMKQVVNSQSVCLCLGDGTLLPFIASKLGAKKVYTLQSNPLCRRTLQRYLQHNSEGECVQIIDKLPGELTAEDLAGNKIDVVLAEPFFLTSVLPWHNLHLGYIVREITQHLSPCVKVLPGIAAFRIMAVQFSDLWKIRAPVGICEGFNLESFDKLIESSSDKTDAYIEPQPLWEYPATCLSQPITVMQFDMSRIVENTKSQVVENTVPFDCDGTCNGVALWMDFSFGETEISTGPVTPPVPGAKVQWDRCTRQGVHLFRLPQTVCQGDILSYKVMFIPEAGEFQFSFDIQRKRSKVT
ncbi:protein arginine N-methyltransferase 7-like [Liolophura sinensis]|uniref:protein arginine N-methyltransferase 7-like n=1 Tax=Liolophura sinensis TaxID=3198878 RepID=UPI0031583020